MSDLTKAEVMAMLEVQKDAATQMQKVASSLAEMTKNQEKTLERLEGIGELLANGVCSKVTDRVGEKIAAVVQPFELRQQTILDSVVDTNKSCFWLKIIIGGATLIALIASVILKVITPSSNIQIEELKHIMHNEMIAFHQGELVNEPNVTSRNS